ncbi:hypothetical protein LCGC14_1029930 [marine sediment metagenome]|uniref:Uncharacterized protein n=1 Tax=marine sediment metagenome TaxID=412755 RepID=A0A0F9MZH0_9ZZZZ
MICKETPSPLASEHVTIDLVDDAENFVLPNGCNRLSDYVLWAISVNGRSHTTLV